MTRRCAAQLGRLRCVREDGHQHGHTYEATTDDLGRGGRHSEGADDQ